MTPESEALLASIETLPVQCRWPMDHWRDRLAAIEAAARKPLEERIAALEAALSTCGDYIVGLGLPCGTRLVWETEYLALLGLIDRLVTKPHGWLAALAQPAPAEEK